MLEDYDQAIMWWEKALEPDEVEGTPCANIRCRAAGLTGATFCKTKRWEESLASLRLSLSYLQVTSSDTEIDIKSDVLKILLDLGFEYFNSKLFARSLECFQLAYDEYIGSPKIKSSAHTLAMCKLYCAASFYGLGNFGQGLELLRGITKGPENPDEMIEDIQDLVELGEH
jgi:tetratricopeptide (TPR) repeat protein